MIMCHLAICTENSENLFKRAEIYLEEKESQEPVAHIYNSSYSGGRDQEDCSLKPARANS
jgi:hypothetical protein